jgi:hypothetical protein
MDSTSALNRHMAIVPYDVSVVRTGVVYMKTKPEKYHCDSQSDNDVVERFTGWTESATPTACPRASQPQQTP